MQGAAVGVLPGLALPAPGGRGAPLGPGPRLLAVAELDPWGGSASRVSVALGSSTRKAPIWERGGPSRLVVQGFLGVPATACPGPYRAGRGWHPPQELLGPRGKPSCLGRPVLHTLQMHVQR